MYYKNSRGLLLKLYRMRLKDVIQNRCRTLQNQRLFCKFWIGTRTSWSLTSLDLRNQCNCTSDSSTVPSNVSSFKGVSSVKLVINTLRSTMRRTPYCDHVPQLMYILGCEMENKGVRFQEYYYFSCPKHPDQIWAEPFSYSGGNWGFYKGVKRSERKTLGMSGVIHAIPIGLHDVQSNRCTFIFIAAYYKQNNLQS